MDDRTGAEAGAFAGGRLCLATATARRARMVELYDADHSLRTIGAEMGIDKTCVRTVLLEEGIELRPIGQYDRSLPRRTPARRKPAGEPPLDLSCDRARETEARLSSASLRDRCRAYYRRHGKPEQRIWAEIQQDLYAERRAA